METYMKPVRASNSFSLRSVFLQEFREYHNGAKNKFQYQEGTRYWKRLVKPMCGNFMFRGWQQE